MRTPIPHFTVYQPNGWSNSILPIDVLHKLINEMNGVIDIVNHMEDESVERAKEYTDSQINIVEDSIAATNNTLDQVNQSLQASIRSINQSITVLQSQLSTYGERLNEVSARELDHYAEIGRTITQIYSDMRALGSQLRNYADVKDLVLKEQLEAEIEELRVVINDILNVETIDGLTGLKRTVRQILSTYIIDKVKRRGGNRYAMTWGQLSDNNNYGWFNKQSQLTPVYWHIIAPTWCNFKKSTTPRFKSAPVGYRNEGIINTWGAFVNDTLLYIAFLCYHIGQVPPSDSDVFKQIDVYTYSEWNAYKYNASAPKPTVITTDGETVAYSNKTYRQLAKEQGATAIICFNAGINYNWLFTSSSSGAGLYNSNNIQFLYLFLLGNTFEKALSDMIS